MKTGKLLSIVLACMALSPLLAEELDAAADESIPQTIRNNRYFLESLRQANLARLAMDEGEYDAVEEYSKEAVRYALLSDEYVRAFLENRKPLLPARYVVRTWKGEKDCLWNIAASSWAYNDPFKWRILYEANKEKLPDPKNPNWLEPGITLDIPPLKGETRRGVWAENKRYAAFS
jgi:nucleoid-associated protein YgaU